ncbi:MAG: hypothetical protein JXA93_04890 [Anaerolineae bacterium]|nr:hypothetical protein [Anaerolineae bacterium]
MTRNFTTITAGLLLILLLSTLGAGLLTVHALPVGGAENLVTDVGVQACYTLDTSRPEWLATSPFVYLPVVLKNATP